MPGQEKQRRGHPAEPRELQDAADLIAPKWMFSFFGRLLDKLGIALTSLVLSVPVLIGVVIAVELLYIIYGVPRDKVPLFGFAYLPISLIFTPLFAYILLKIIDRERQLRHQLERRTVDFEKADRTKSEFLASMSHELRTPLNAILGYSEVIRDESLGPGKSDVYRKYADDIHRSGAHLLSLINDLLDVSKIEAGRIQLVDETLDLSDLIETCLTLVGTVMAEKGIQVCNDLADSDLQIQADSRAASQVIVNLLSNAVRHNQSCTISIIGQKSAGKVVVDIQDDGAGIPPGKMATIYEPFTQGISIRAGGGAGLGLPISKRLMESLGGDLRLVSAPGAGTTATLTFRSP